MIIIYKGGKITSRKISVILVFGLFLLLATGTFITEGKDFLKIHKHQNNMIEIIGDLGFLQSLSYYPESHDFGNKQTGEIDNTTFEIWNSGCCMLFYELTWNCSWVDVHPTNGSSIDEHDTIFVDINTTGLLPGPYVCDISILSNGGNGVFTVTVNIVATLHVGGEGPGNYTHIQDAIDNASDGDTIYVYNDSSPYSENVIVNKMINLIGEDRNTTIIDGGEDGDVVYISADSVIISGFTIQNCGYLYAGINVKSDYNKINDNIISNNEYGIYLKFCSNNIISNNNICFQTDTGIRADYTNNNTISRNNVSSNEGLGICFKFEGIYNIISDNIISSNIEGNIGVSYESCYNNISNNRISSSDYYGIDIYQQSCHNIISTNHISSHNSQGISIRYLSNDNTIYHNNFIENSQNAYDECTNNWDNGYPSGGNYWDDYTGTDSNGDGIGDTPYEIPGDSNQDNYPLIFPYSENPPVANFSYSVNDLSVLFNGSSSYDRDGEIVSYKWNFGDGNYGTGMITGHTYSNSGTYTVTLNVTDDDNLTDNTSQNVTIADESPPQISNLQAIPPVQSPGGYVNISATVKENDKLADVCLIIRYPDNYVENISILENKTGDTYYYNRTYDMIGLYFYHIWAVDISGNNANSPLKNFEITEEFVANAGGPYYGYVSEPIQFYGYAINGVPPYSWHWNFGDGDTSDEQNPMHTYTDAGNHTVTLTVTDDEGNTANDTTWALIEELPFLPPPEIYGPLSGKIGVEYDYYFLIPYITYCDALRLRVDWGDTGPGKWHGPYEPGENVTLPHTWRKKGDYTIRAQVMDVFGAESDWSDPLEVTMPRNRITTKILLLRFLEQFPLLQKLLL